MAKHPKVRAIKEDFISRLSSNARHIVALAVLFILPLVMYSAIFFGGKQYLGNDVLQYRAGAQSVIHYKHTHGGEHPLWDTNMFSGMPSYVIHNPSPPPNIDTFFKFIGGNTDPLPYFWILLFGAYFFFILQDLRPFSAALGSILIGFTTYLPIILEAGHNNQFRAFAFIPWMLAGYYMLSRWNTKKMLAFFVFALSMTLELRANHPQVTYYFLYLMGFWWLYDTWRYYQNDEIKAWLQRTALAFGAGILALLSTIALYWRTYVYTEYSIRGGSALDAAQGAGLSIHYAFNWSQGVGELFTLIVPGLYGGSSGQAYWGPKPFTSGPHYLGAIAFILALIGLIKYRKKIKYLFFGVGTLSLLFSLGSHFLLLNKFMFDYVPYFNKFRTPEMWLMVTVFCYSVLAVYGIEALIRMARDRVSSFRDLLVPVGITIALGVIFTFGSNALFSFNKPGEMQQYSQRVAQRNNVSANNPRVKRAVRNLINTRIKPKRKKMAHSDSIRFLILTLIAAGLIWAFMEYKLSLGFMLTGLIVLTIFDLFQVDYRYIHEDNMASDRLDAERLVQQQQRPADKFIMQHNQSGQGYPYRVYPLDDNPFNNAIPAYFYPTIGGYTGVKLGYYQDLAETFFQDQGGQPTLTSHSNAILDMLNVKFITTNKKIPFNGYTQVYSQKNQIVYRNDNVLPKAFFVDSVKTVSSARQAISLMKSKAHFNPATKAIVESDSTLSSSVDSTASVNVSSYSAKSISLKTSSSTNQFLVLSEIYYPAGWNATIDGKPLHIYKTNYVLRGMEIPAGKHTVKMTFEPVSNKWGQRLDWVGHIILLACGIGAVFMIFKERQSDDNQQ